MTADWFHFNGKMHARDAERSKRKNRLITLCGLSPAAIPAAIVTLDDTEVPASACPTCLVAVATDSTSDEPLDHALERGYLPSSVDVL